jgi:hypothetical protein
MSHFSKEDSVMKHSKYARGRALVSVVCAFSLVACSSTTVIRTTDPETKIYLDGEYRGTGSVVESNTRLVGSTTMVKLQKPGCAAKNVHFSRNEEVDVGALIGGIFLLVPFLWIMKYKPEHVYEYRCISAGAPTSDETVPYATER